MVDKKNILAVILFSVFYVFMFANNSFGLNIPIFYFSFLGFLLYRKILVFKNLYQKTMIISFASLTFVSVFVNSNWTYFLLFFMYIILSGVIIFPDSKLLMTNLWQGIFNFFTGIYFFSLKAFSKDKSNNYDIMKLKKYFKYLLPLFIIFVFFGIYNIASPIFEEFSNEIERIIGNTISDFFKIFDAEIIFKFILGLLLTSMFIFTKKSNYLVSSEQDLNNNYRRKVINNKFYVYKFNSLLNEYKTGVFLFFVLNVLLLFVNIIDIRFLWFNFEWSGQLLKNFLHNGTFMLVISIFLSVGVILYYFRGNINLFSENQLLKNLAYIWLLQNAILAISVGIRVYWYIYYYNLAYKRIAVVFFLLLVIYGLYTVYVKVKNKKSFYYLFRTNFYALIVVLSISGLFNWDSIITKYNFKHSTNSYLDLSYLGNMPDKTLPYLIKSDIELTEINDYQSKEYSKYYLSGNVAKFKIKINKRLNEFIEKYPQQNILEWNLPDYLAYTKLKSYEIELPEVEIEEKRGFE